ncbi:MAG: aldo/keto reductase [Firmicutes bacterium]|nr:aldo/keto reductase [Bacillota bacterium]
MTSITNRPGGTYNIAGIDVSRVGYGTMQLPKLKDEKQAKAILRKAYELGINHFDTAYFYANGLTNRLLAEELGTEKNVLFISKIGAKPTKRGPMPMLPAQRPEELRKDVEDNLKSLCTDRLDVVNFRRIAPGTFPLTPAQKVNFDDQMAEILKMKDEGLIGAIGLSSIPYDELKRALPTGIVCVQNHYNLTARNNEGALELCKAKQIAWIPFFPLGGGLPCSCKVTDEPIVQEVSKEIGISPIQTALAWILNHSDNSLIIPGTTSIKHLEQNAAVGSIKLTDAQMKKLDCVQPKGINKIINRMLG